MSKTFISIFAKSCAIILFPALALFLALFLPSSLHSQIPAYVPTNGLVGYWPFNGNANDESGNGNHGTVNGATLTSDINNISNQSYSFDGVNDFISIGNIPVINGNNSRSFVAWVKINPGQNGGVIISQGAELFQSGCNQGFHFNATSALADCAYSGCGIITNCSQVRHPYLLNDGNWHQVAVTYSSGGYGGLAFYADGQFISTNPNNCIQGDQYSEFNTGSMFGVNFGKRNDEYFSNCTLDDIAIYNRALTQEEITALYNGTTNSGGGNNIYNTANTTVPAGISYQAVARNAQGNTLANTAVQVKFSLITDSLSGTTEYVETHSLSTNSMGLFATAFGTGTAVTGTWAGINWTHSNKYLKVEMDAGNGFVDLGTQQLLSVPFAIKANESNKVKNAGLPVYSNNAAALAGGLVAGEMYRTAAGALFIVY